MDKLFSKLKKEKLNVDEKSKIFIAIRDFAETHPPTIVESPFFSIKYISNHKIFATFSVAMFVMIFTVFGTSYAAIGSLPGEILYPIKLFNEEVQSFFTTGSNASAELDVSHAISRLNEIEQLANAGQLSQKTTQITENQINNQLQKAIQSINTLKDTGNATSAAKINSHLEKSLSEQVTNISKIIDNGSTTPEIKAELGNVISNINSKMPNINESTATSSKSNDGDHTKNNSIINKTPERKSIAPIRSFDDDNESRGEDD